MKPYNPVSKFNEFLKKQTTNEANTMKTNPSTPFVNLLRSYNFDIKIHPKSDTRFGNQCEVIRIGNDWDAYNAFMAEINPVHTEEELADSYGEDWMNDPEAKSLLGKTYSGDKLTFNFFTHSSYSNSDALKEEALTYAQHFYKMYIQTGIKANDGLDLISENEQLQEFLKFTGVEIRSNAEIPLVITACYRAYQDRKCIWEAEDLFEGTDFLDEFVSM